MTAPVLSHNVRAFLRFLKPYGEQGAGKYALPEAQRGEIGARHIAKTAGYAEWLPEHRRWRITPAGIEVLRKG